MHPSGIVGSQILPQGSEKVLGRVLRRGPAMGFARNQGLRSFFEWLLGRGDVRVWKGTGVSQGVQSTTWERSLKNGNFKCLVLKSFLWREHFGTRP